MLNELTYPIGLIYIGIVIILAIIIAVLAARVTALKNENKYLLSRRERGQKCEEAVSEESERPKPQISNACGIICSYRDVEIPELKSKISSLNKELENAHIHIEILQSTNAKLRMKRRSEYVQND